MNAENIIEYIRRSHALRLGAKFYRSDLRWSASFILFYLGICCATSSAVIKIASCIIYCLYIIMLVTGHILTSKGKHKKYIFLVSFMSEINFLIFLSFLVCFCYYEFFGIDVLLFLCVSRTIIIRVTLLIMNTKKMKSQKPAYKEKKTIVSAAPICAFAGAGAVFGKMISRKYAEKLSQQSMVIFVIVVFLLFIYFFSFSWLELQRYYYYLKLEKLGLVDESILEIDHK